MYPPRFCQRTSGRPANDDVLAGVDDALAAALGALDAGLADDGGAAGAAEAQQAAAGAGGAVEAQLAALALVVGWLGAGVVPLLRLGRLGAGVVPLLRPVWLGCLAQVGVVPRSLTC
eukprot:SAG22_NODE_39_length_26283_cov_18.486653_8_plen_117_part_00